MATIWRGKIRDYPEERKCLLLKKEETFNHPLKPTTVTVTDAKNRKVGGKLTTKGSRSSSISSDKGSSRSAVSSSGFVDPLSTAFGDGDPLSKLVSEETDPLSKLASQIAISDNKHSHKGKDTRHNQSAFDESFEPWSAKKSGILNKYTTSEKLSITTSFLSPTDKEKVIIKAQPSSVSDKVKHRLEQLDDFEEGSVKEMLNLSQQDYVRRIDELNNALITAWDQDQRVKALKIAIQCAKLLADVSVIQFYPSKFVLITDILDTFGRLVQDRLFQKSSYYPPHAAKPVPLPENFTPDQVPESAKETCRNWFFKIASIRELIPRFYVETAILKCYSFLATNEYTEALKRLTVMIRGIGDPLVALYARCYICRVGISIAPDIRDYAMPCYEDFLTTYNQIGGDSVQNLLATQKLELGEYLTLYSPGLDWLLQCIAVNSTEKVMVKVLDMSNNFCNSALLLNSIMSAFKPAFISARGLEFCVMIKECEETGFPKHMLYKSLGTCLVLSEPPEEQKLGLLNDVWKVVMKLKNPTDYITCAEVWIEYVVQHFGKQEVNIFLGDIIKHMTPDRAYEEHYPQLQSVVSKVVTHMHNYSVLFALDKFMAFIDMFQKDSVKVEVCKNIMDAYVRNQIEPTNDPVILNASMFICKTMHDSVNALSLDDEIRVIGNLINSFIRSISFGRDFEQQLSFYVEARASFSNIDAVVVHLVHCVNTLAMKTRSIIKANHTRKTAAFVRACAAYCFITIPSLHNVFSRLNLYLLSGEVALLNLCLSQSDAFFKAAVSILPEVPRMIDIDGKSRSSEPLLQEYISNLLSALLILPDNPDQGVLYLLRGLLNTVQSHQWDTNLDTKMAVYFQVLNMLSAASQESYVYHIDNVDSNDTLYGSDPKFMAEVDGISNTLVDEILGHLQNPQPNQNPRRTAVLAFDLFNRIITHSDIGNEQLYRLAINLWAKAERGDQIDVKILTRPLAYLKMKSNVSGSNVYKDLLASLCISSRNLQMAFSKLA